MFNIGGGEVLLILLVALVVLGPDKLPEAARQAGKVMRDFRRISSGFQTELRNAMKDPVGAALEERKTTPAAPDPMAAYVRQEEEKQARAAEEKAEQETDEEKAAEADAAGESDGAEPEPDVPTDPEAGIPSDR